MVVIKQAALLSKVTQQMSLCWDFMEAAFLLSMQERENHERRVKHTVFWWREWREDSWTVTLTHQLHTNPSSGRRSHCSAATSEIPTLPYLPQPQPRSASVPPVVRSWEWNIHEVIWMTKEVKWDRFKEVLVCGTWRQTVIIIVSCFLGSASVKTSPTCQTNS